MGECPEKILAFLLRNFSNILVEFFKCISDSASLDSECVFYLYCVLCTGHVNNSFLVLNSAAKSAEQIMPP